MNTHPNVGFADARLRLVVAVMLALFAVLLTSGLLQLVLCAVSLVLVGTAVFRTCPIYHVARISTYPMNRRAI